MFLGLQKHGRVSFLLFLVSAVSTLQ